MRRWLDRLNRRLLLRYRIEYVAALVVVYGVRALSPAFAWRLARWTGRAAHTYGLRRKAALRNLAIAFPEKSEAERAAIAKRTFEHFGSVVIDIIFQRRMLTKRSLFRKIKYTGWSGDYMEHYGVKGLRRRSKRVLYLTGHLGNWEMGSGMFGLLGIDIVPVFRAVRNPFLDTLLKRIRLGSQSRVVERRGAVDAMMDIFDEKGNVGFLFDQEAVYGLTVPFFGVEATTHKTPAILARDHRVKLYFGLLVRRGDFLRYEARGQRIDDVPRTDDRNADLLAITRDLVRRLEDEIRLFPDQYLWMHRRWKRAGVHKEN